MFAMLRLQRKLELVALGEGRLELTRDLHHLILKTPRKGLALRSKSSHCVIVVSFEREHVFVLLDHQL